MTTTRHPDPISPDLMDTVWAVVTRNHPNLTGAALHRKVRRVAAILAYSQDGTLWTGATR